MHTTPSPLLNVLFFVAQPSRLRRSFPAYLTISIMKLISSLQHRLFCYRRFAEDGISGRTYHSRLIMLSIDKQQHAINEDFVFETICHELSHSLRWEKVPEYAKTLFDGMILEGLAVVLEEAAMAATQRPTRQYFLNTMQKTSIEEINSIIAILKDTFNSMDYDYTRVFFTGDNTLPRWAGYRLGCYFVKQYLEKTNRTIVQATEDRYQTFAKVLCS